MKRLAVLALMTLLASAAGAKVWTTVYRCDEVTPLEAVDPNHPTIYRDIMVGTRLAIVISSDAAVSWSGILVSSWEDWLYGELTPRGYNPVTRNYDGSCLPAAGRNPFALITRPTNWVGLQFGTRSGPLAGEWFIMDYHAKQVGACTLRLYDLPVKLGFPLETLSFTHGPSRDFNGDTIVDFQDFALLASRWSATVDPDPNSPQVGFDLDGDGRIGLGDLALFSEYWLERTDCRPTGTDPNDPLVSNP